MTDKRDIDHFKGCLIGGAIGDSLGAPVEFMSLDQIRSAFGVRGLSDYAAAYGRTGAITDDTQMTLFTAEGLILSRVRQEYQGTCGTVTAVYHALLRWLSTQETDLQGRLIKSYGTCSMVDGILTGHKALFSRRAPGNSCLSALASGRMGTTETPVNDSKGCGGVMRMAPVGLAFRDPEKAFRIGCDCAALTHGHPSGYLSAGMLASMISMIMAGQTLSEAVNESLRILKTDKNHQEILELIDKAVDMADQPMPGPETIQTLGAGWVAEEALAIGIYCALAAKEDIAGGLLLSVNHSGDSDSTGSITGNILGAFHGLHAIPANWSERLELRSLIEEIAGDLLDRSE